MPDPAKTPHLGHLHILTPDEVQSIFALPQFTAAEQRLYFSLTPTELAALAQARSFASKLTFILQLGYFKARHLFFNFAWPAVAADVEFIRHQYFPNEKKKLLDLPQVVKNTVFRQRRIIAALGNYQFCGRAQRKMLAQAAQKFAQLSSQPHYLLRELLTFLQTHRIILPGYSSLQDLIAQALRSEAKRLKNQLQNQLTADHTQQLEKLLSAAASFYEITHLKHEPRDFTHLEIKREAARGLQIKELYHLAQTVLPSLAISNQSIAYYASLVLYYRVDKLKRFASGTTHLYLLCFIHQRYQRVQDNLINSLLYRVRLYSDQAKEFGHTKLSSLQLTTHQSIGKAAAVLRLLTNEQIPPETPFGLVQQKAFAILGRDEINQIAAHIAQESPLEEGQFRWEYLDQIAAQFKLHLRSILLRVDFTPVTEPSELAHAIHFLRQAFTREQSLASIPPKKFPLGFLAEKTLPYLYQTDPKSNQRQLRPNRYEFLVYQALAHALQSGDLYCRASQTFRSFEEDLIDDQTWQQKEALIEESNLSILAEPIELHLQALESQLEGLLMHVNQRIANRENKSFHRPEKSARWTLKYPTQPETPAEVVFEALPPTDLYQVLRFVQQQTDFIGAFSHVRGRYVKQQADQVVLAACLMAWGTNTGLGKMGKISDFKTAVLQTASDNFLRPETLHQANARIINEIAKFDLFQQYNLAETIHSSSDGQKFETRFQTINARYSPKYFGLKKGIVAYTLVANHIPVTARIIGANEHESHFVFDVLFNNTTNIQPTIHSTDTHGSNQVNAGFAASVRLSVCAALQGYL